MTHKCSSTMKTWPGRFTRRDCFRGAAPPRWDFEHLLALIASFRWASYHRKANEQKEKGEFTPTHTWTGEVVQMSPKTRLPFFVYANGIVFFFPPLSAKLMCVRSRVFFSSSSDGAENQQKPVISHFNAGLKANMKINWGNYNSGVWMEQNPPNQGELVYHSGTMFGCLPRSSAFFWALKLI